MDNRDTIKLHHSKHGHVIVNADDAESLAAWRKAGYSDKAPAVKKEKPAKPSKPANDGKPSAEDLSVDLDDDSIDSIDGDPLDLDVDDDDGIAGDVAKGAAV